MKGDKDDPITEDDLPIDIGPGTHYVAVRSDFKIGARRKDPDLMRILHLDPDPCCVCGDWGSAMHLHHIVKRSQGGDDSRENLAWLCGRCHMDLHASRLTAAQLASIVPIS